MELTAVILLSVTCFLCLLTVTFVAVFAFKITNSLIRIGELRQNAPSESVLKELQTDQSEEAYAPLEEYDEADFTAPQSVTLEETAAQAQAPSQSQRLTQPAAKEEPQAQAEQSTQFVSKEKVVSFTAEKKTFEDKYNALSPAHKSLYDEIAQYASAKQFIHRFKNKKYEEFKMGYDSVVKLTIRRGTVWCEFVSVNDRFGEFLISNGLAVIKGVSVMEISDEASAQTAKECIAVSYDEVCKERLKRAEARRVAT